MRVLAIDPGLTRCGVAAVDSRAGRQVSMVAVDVIKTPTDDDLALRLLGIAEAIEGWLDQLKPDVLAIERVFAQANVASAMGTAQAAGVIAVAAAKRGIPIAHHTPSEVKAAVTGSGKAGKKQVAAMVTRILKLPETPRPADAADALALAICHIWRAGSPAAAVGTASTAAQSQWRDAAQASRSRAKENEQRLRAQARLRERAAKQR